VCVCEEDNNIYPCVYIIHDTTTIYTSIHLYIIYRYAKSRERERKSTWRSVSSLEKEKRREEREIMMMRRRNRNQKQDFVVGFVVVVVSVLLSSLPISVHASNLRVTNHGGHVRTLPASSTFFFSSTFYSLYMHTFSIYHIHTYIYIHLKIQQSHHRY
jgi:hypothetical protein